MKLTHTAARPEVGTRVVVKGGRLSGSTGVVTWTGRDGSCGCWSVVVRTDRGEWYGKRSEVEVV